MLHRGEHDLMLKLASAPDQVRPHGKFGTWDFHLRVADLEAERRAIEAAGASCSTLRRTEYGMIEIEVEDPDGHPVASSSPDRPDA